MRNIYSYHHRRRLREETMAADATSAVARISHSKLALLHGKSAERAGAALALAEAAAVPVGTSAA